jgi:hypothetical protein
MSADCSLFELAGIPAGDFSGGGKGCRTAAVGKASRGGVRAVRQLSFERLLLPELWRKRFGFRSASKQRKVARVLNRMTARYVSACTVRYCGNRLLRGEITRADYLAFRLAARWEYRGEGVQL